MNTIGSDKIDLVIAIYEQHCLHIRHVENQRMWFTNIFAILCGGSLALMRGGLFDQTNWPVISFLMVLSLIGFVFCLRIQGVFNAHHSVAELILRRYGLEHYIAKSPKTVARKFFRLSLLFPSFFLLCFSFFLFVLLRIQVQITWLNTGMPLFIFVAGTVFIYVSKYDRPLQSDED